MLVRHNRSGRMAGEPALHQVLVDGRLRTATTARAGALEFDVT